MYQAHFGLAAPLRANGIARDARVYTGDGRRRRVEQRLDGALARGDACVLLCGAAGTGKTTLAAHVVRARGPRLAFGWIAHPPGRPPELLELLVGEFGLSPEQAKRDGILRSWRQLLHEMAVTETSVCVLVEHADELGTDVLRALESLTAADPSGCPGANLILMSRAPLAERLRQPGLEGLAQRISANLRLEPLDAGETRRYLEFAVAACGGRLDKIADEGAVRALHAHSGGIIRVVDNLAEAALELAAERGGSAIDAALVEEVASELCCGPARAGAEPATLEHAHGPESSTRPAASGRAASAPEARPGGRTPHAVGETAAAEHERPTAGAEAPIADKAPVAETRVAETRVADEQRSSPVSPTPAAGRETAGDKSSASVSARRAGADETLAADDDTLAEDDLLAATAASLAALADDDSPARAARAHTPAPAGGKPAERAGGRARRSRDAGVPAAGESTPADDLPVLTDVIDVAGRGENATEATPAAPGSASGQALAHDGARPGAGATELEPGVPGAQASAAAAGLSATEDAAVPSTREDDAQADALEALATALELEDFSNYVAETVFAENELDAMSQTLSVSERAGAREGKLTGT